MILHALRGRLEPNCLPSMADGRRHAVITSDDHGPVLGIISWVMMVSMIMMVALRLAIRFSSRNPGIDDALATLAMVRTRDYLMTKLP